MTEQSSMQDRFRKTFLLLLVIFISCLFVAMLRSFLVTILLAAIFSGMTYPLYTRVLAGVRGRKVVASALTLVVVVALVFGPLLAFLGVVVAEAIKITNLVGPWIEEQLKEPGNLSSHLDRIPGIERLEPYRQQILTRAGQLVGTIGNFIVSGLSATTKGTVQFFFHFFILLYTMFFFLMDGPRVMKRILYYIPLGHDDEMRMADKFVSVTRATMKGTLVIGVIQGGLAGLALWVAGIPSPVFWGTLMVVLSIIPGIGTALVWLPAAIVLIGSGHVLSGVLVILFCGLVVGSVDNILRPRLVGKDTQMHELFILFGTLGGILLFGIVGFIIGPILAALFVTVWEVYGVVFKDVLGDAKS